jgi:hypothetical protein
MSDGAKCLCCGQARQVRLAALAIRRCPVTDAGDVMQSLVRVDSAADALGEALAAVPSGYTAAGLRASDNVARAVRAAAQIIRQAYPVTFGHALPGLHLIAGQPLDPAELPGRVRGALSREGIRDWGGLADCGVQDLLGIRMLGTGSVRLIAEAAVWRVAVIALIERAGSPVVPDAAAARRAMPPGCVAMPLQALAAWAVAERGMTTVGDLLALAPGMTGLPTEIASEWELARYMDLRRLAGGPSTTPQLPGLLRDLLAEIDERRREILTRRTFAPQPQTLDTLAAAFGISRGRVRQLEESARVQIAIAARGPRYAPLRWRAHTQATGTDPDPGLLHTAGPWAGNLLRWLAKQAQPPPGHKT